MIDITNDPTKNPEITVEGTVESVISETYEYKRIQLCSIIVLNGTN